MYLLHKRIIIIMFLFILHCEKQLSEEELLNKTNPNGLYGSGITLKNKNNINDLMNNSQKYLGTNVLVTGEIMEVCPMRGCWIDIKALNSESRIRIKVTDGDIVFPLTAKGSYIDVEGQFVKLQFTKEQALNWKRHLAAEKGIQLNIEDIKITPEDLIEFRINGQAANIYSSNPR